MRGKARAEEGGECPGEAEEGWRGPIFGGKGVLHIPSGKTGNLKLNFFYAFGSFSP